MFLGLRASVASALILCAGCSLTNGLFGPREAFRSVSNDEPIIPATGPSLKGKRVVVITTLDPAVKAEFPTLDCKLDAKVVAHLKEKKEGEIIDADKVFAWVDGHPHWTDPEEIAKAFAADFVIVLGVEAFRLHDPGDSSALQGTAKTHVSVSETTYPVYRGKRIAMQMPEETRLIYTEDCETVFPVRGPIEKSSGVSIGAFTSRFLQVVACELSWKFVGHNPEEDIQDVKFSGR